MPIDPRPEFVIDQLHEFVAKNGRRPDKDEWADCYRHAQARELIDLFESGKLNELRFK